jgi:hypothetical protein
LEWSLHEGVPVGPIRRCATGQGHADKAAMTAAVGVLEATLARHFRLASRQWVAWRRLRTD